MAIPVVVISLARSIARRAQISERLGQLGVSFAYFDAIDGKNLSAVELEQIAPTAKRFLDRPLIPGEIGCAASHLEVIRSNREAGYEFICVLEDDAEIDPDFARFLDGNLLGSLMPFDVLRLVSDPDRWKRPSWIVRSIAGRNIHAMARPGWCMQGQIYSRGGLRKITSQVICVHAPIDNVLYHDCHIKGLRVLEVRPGVIEHDHQFTNPALAAKREIGYRGSYRAPMLTRNFWRWRRKTRAAIRFIQAWGLSGLGRILVQSPAGHFR